MHEKAGVHTENRCEALEFALSARLVSRHCCLVQEPWQANLLAVQALTSPVLGERAILHGDEIIALSASDEVQALIARSGACPVPVTQAPQEGRVALSLLESALSPMTKAVYLRHEEDAFDLRDVRNFCNKYELWLIEDSTALLGAPYLFDGKLYYKGTVGDVGTVSFPSQGPAAVLTNDHTLARLLVALRTEQASVTEARAQACLDQLTQLP